MQNAKLDVEFRFVELMNGRPAADAMLRIAGERIATPVCALVRNDIKI